MQLCLNVTLSNSDADDAVEIFIKLYNSNFNLNE